MGAALRAVDLVEMSKREFQLPSQGFDAGPELACRQRGELVKERLNDHRIDDDHDHLESKANGLG